MATHRKPIAMPVIGTDIDVARVAAVMNLLAANLAAPQPVSMSFWPEAYPDAEVAFLAFAAQHRNEVRCEERNGALYLDRVELHQGRCGIGTFYKPEAVERIERERLEREGAKS